MLQGPQSAPSYPSQALPHQPLPLEAPRLLNGNCSPVARETQDPRLLHYTRDVAQQQSFQGARVPGLTPHFPTSDPVTYSLQRAREFPIFAMAVAKSAEGALYCCYRTYKTGRRNDY